MESPGQEAAPPEAPGVTRRDLGRRNPISGFVYLAMVVVLLLAFLVQVRRQPEPVPSEPAPSEPVPEYTLYKPLDPSPIEAFAHLMERHAATSYRIADSGATEWKIYEDKDMEVGEYCTHLGLLLAKDWSNVVHAPTRTTGWLSVPDAAWWRLRIMVQDYRFEKYHYVGPALSRLDPLCDELMQVLAFGNTSMAQALHVDMTRIWGVAAVNTLFRARFLLRRSLPNAMNGPRLIEDGPSTATSSSGGGSLVGNQALDASLTVPVLEDLSFLLGRHRDNHSENVPEIKAVAKALDRGVALGEELLGLRWEDWMALNRPRGSVIRPEDDTSSRKERRRLAKLGDTLRTSISVLKDVQRRSSGPLAEGLAVIGSDIDQLQGWIDGLIAGRGWSRIARHGEHWVLYQYHLSLRPDLRAWLLYRAYALFVRQRKFEKGYPPLDFSKCKPPAPLWERLWDRLGAAYFNTTGQDVRTMWEGLTFLQSPWLYEEWWDLAAAKYADSWGSFVLGLLGVNREIWAQ